MSCILVSEAFSSFSGKLKYGLCWHNLYSLTLPSSKADTHGRKLLCQSVARAGIREGTAATKIAAEDLHCYQPYFTTHCVPLTRRTSSTTHYRCKQFTMGRNKVSLFTRCNWRLHAILRCSCYAKCVGVPLCASVHSKSRETSCCRLRKTDNEYPAIQVQRCAVLLQ